MRAARRMPRNFAALTPAVIAIAALISSPAHADELVLTPIAVSRQTAPVGGRYVLFGSMNIDSLRRVTFTASLSRGQVGIFRSERGTVVPLVLTGDDAPDDAGTAFDTLLDAASNAQGDLAFISTVFSPPRMGVFLRRNGVTTTLALQGEPAPTRRGEYLGGFGLLKLVESGDVYFSAELTDAPFSVNRAGQAIVRAPYSAPGSGTSALEGLIAPGDQYGGEREIATTFQFDVNEAGEISTLADITSASLQPQTVAEVVRYAGGKLQTLASANVPISSAGDFARSFAITFDQIRVLPAGESVFYAETNDFLSGGYFINEDALPYENHKEVVQGDRTPLSPTDRFIAFGGFGINAARDMAFHALSNALPEGGLFLRTGGTIRSVAKAGERRPDGMDDWHGFLMVEMNASGAFAFTDFQDRFVQVAVYLARNVPEPSALTRQIAEVIQAAAVDRSIASGLLSQLRVIGRNADRSRINALRCAEALRREVQSRSGRSLPATLVNQIDPLLEDLIISLGGPTSNAGRRPPTPRLLIDMPPESSGPELD